MVGGGPGTDKKFVGKMLELMSTRDKVSVVDDKFGSITYANDLANGILKLIKTGKYGLYHLCNQGFTSRFDIAQEIARIKGFKVKIHPICSAKFPLPAPRARSEAMVNYKLNLLGLNPMRPWNEALAAYLAEWPAKEAISAKQ
jgi:dTDP-4-dehydrorhamnose reductase